jgi:hypothetical protein
VFVGIRSCKTAGEWSLLLRSATYKVDDLKAIFTGQRTVLPFVSRDDFAVMLDCDPIALQFQFF